MDYHIYSFEKLDVYRLGVQLSVDIRRILHDFPLEEKFVLKSQLIRAVDSIGANIAEGSGRASNLDQAHFTNMAYSSALEVIHHINLALKLNYIEMESYRRLRVDLDELINKLNALYKFQVRNKNTLKAQMKR